MSNGSFNLTNEQWRSLVLETLKKVRIEQVSNLRHAVADVARKQGFEAQTARVRTVGQGDGLDSMDFARVQEIFWDLIIEGVIRPGLLDGVNNNLPFFHITEWGRKVIAEGPVSPYDPDQYFAHLNADITAIDPIIVTYLNESMHTLRIGCLLSSTIALGCASEKALLLLIAAYRDSLPRAMAEKFRASTENRMIKRQFDELHKMIGSDLRARLPPELSDGLDVELTALFDFIRTQRNDAGHPTGKLIERERAYANLVVFPVHLKKVYGLMNWLTANPK